MNQPMHIDRQPRHPLGFFPTPVHPLPRLSALLGGPRILIKRDDQTGLALGGNKTRKLEYLVADALAGGCDTLITAGAAQSNHCRQTAAAAAVAGMGCHLVLSGAGRDLANGNLLLDELLGAAIHWSGDLRKGEMIPETEEALRHVGKTPYVIPYGGSNTIGAIGFVRAAGELTQQLRTLGESVTQTVVASSSGGTQAGLLVGKVLYGLATRLIGIGIDKGEAGDEPFELQVLKLARATAQRLGLHQTLSLADVVVRSEFLGAGYGVVGDAEREAIQLMARTEGVLLDPVYTGRAMAGLIAMIRSGELTQADTVLFWHTGGAPALFAYAGDLGGAEAAGGQDAEGGVCRLPRSAQRPEAAYREGHAAGDEGDVPRLAGQASCEHQPRHGRTPSPGAG
jgi:D-cysteine desulfhydrase family pyridoxal phosphate-dependent enzyme